MLFPFNPHNWLNYIFGTTSLSFKHFVIGNTGKLLDIGIIVWLGTQIEHFTTADDVKNILHGGSSTFFIILSVCLFISIFTYITITIKRVLDEALAEKKDDNEFKLDFNEEEEESGLLEEDQLEFEV